VEGGTVTELVGIARFKIHEGKLEEFKRLSAQAMEIVKTKDTGTLRYDTYFNDDESECVILEFYRDSLAAMEHAEHLADLSAAVLATVSVVLTARDGGCRRHHGHDTQLGWRRRTAGQVQGG